MSACGETKFSNALNKEQNGVIQAALTGTLWICYSVLIFFEMVS
jgi:hypothetical protein